MNRWRVGCVPYMNAKPLIWGLDRVVHLGTIAAGGWSNGQSRFKGHERAARFGRARAGASLLRMRRLAVGSARGRGRERCLR